MSSFEILSTIVQPTDLHKYSDKELQQVADELRQAIIERVSETGGHFSSNLGTVELTVALYATHSLPPDKVIWDTGHQAYPHKMLTGRLDRFDTLRKHKGLSGFLKRDEHPLDSFGAGHAGTAISAALGFAAARDRLGTNEKVVAIVGDASICSGMSWEALNHAGEMQTDLMVILNDNRMSIAPNVGALTRHFTRLRSRPWVQDMAQRAKDIVQRMPSPVVRVASGLRHGLTHYFAPEEAGAIFEEIGFEYIGPVDGHDLPAMLDLFRNLRELRAPLFLHAITTKGKGYAKAEDDSRKWHGVAPFDIATSEITKATAAVSYTQVFGDALVEASQTDDRIAAITAAMPDGTGLTEFSKLYPQRYYDVGIAEEHAVTFAAGLAAGGMKPFCAIYSTFLQRAFDQVLHDVCLQKLPVRFFLDRAGLVGDDGPTHHGAFDISYLNCIPNLTLAAPRDTTELREMVHFAAEFDSGPIAVRYPRGASDDRLPERRTPLAVGKAEVLESSENSQATLLAVGSMVSVAWEARTQLAAEGVSVDVINARFIKPFDAETIFASARSTGTLIVLEENVRTGGFGQTILDAVHREGIPCTVEIISLPDGFVEHGAQPIIRAESGLTPERVTELVLAKGKTKRAH